MKGEQRRMLVDSRGSASQSSSLRREPTLLFLAPEVRGERGKMISAFDPRLCTWFATDARAPWPSAIIVTTAAMPIVIPVIVSDGRSLFRRTIRSAMRIDAISLPSMSLDPEGGDGVHLRGPPGGQESEDYPDRRAGRDGGDHRRDRERQGDVSHLAADPDQQGADQDA